MAHQYELLIHAFTVLAYPGALAILSAPQLEVLVFFFASSEQEDAALGILLDETVDDLFHQARWIYLPLMGSKGSNTYPLLVTLLGTEGGRQQIQIATFLGEDRVEIPDVNGIAQALKYCCIILK